MTLFIVACPEAMAETGRAITRGLCATLGVGEDWLSEAFTNPFWTAQDGSVQCVMSMLVADLDGLVSAFEALDDAPVEVWFLAEEAPPVPQAHLGGLVAVVGLGPQEALAALQLSRIPQDEE